MEDSFRSRGIALRIGYKDQLELAESGKEGLIPCEETLKL
jgi:hypothetical protein